jgi:hypothetical protein
VIAGKSGEIGMHLHAWSTPPFVQITENDCRNQPYLVEYPDRTMERKIDSVTKALEDCLAARVTSHRAGRWAMDERYARMIGERGYLVDCSVTPHVPIKRSYSESKYLPIGYGNFPDKAYPLSLLDISKAGTSGVLEVPVSIVRSGRSIAGFVDGFSPRLGRKLFGPRWLRPTGSNLDSMKSIVRSHPKTPDSYLEFMIHSSELMPGGSPNFTDDESIEKLYSDMEELFRFASLSCEAMTLSEYREFFIEGRKKESI